MSSTRLDPVRRPRLRRGPLLRGIAVVALLSLAALLLYAPPDSPACPTPAPVAVSPPRRLPVPTGLLGLPIGLTDPAALAVLRAGDRVDVYGQRNTVARDALVLGASDPDATPMLYVAVSEADAARLLALDTESRFRVVVRPP